MNYIAIASILAAYEYRANSFPVLTKSTRRAPPSSSTCFATPWRERTRSDRRDDGYRTSGGERGRRDGNFDPFGEDVYDNDYDKGGRDYYQDDSDDFGRDSFDRRQTSTRTTAASATATVTTPGEKASTFYSRKPLTDPSFSTHPHFLTLCSSAGIAQPSRIQSLAWPVLSRGENAIVADQTGSGKTYAYLLPLLQRLHEEDEGESTSQLKRKRTGAPRILVLTPTAELADQIYSVCSSLSSSLSGEWNFHPFVTTATGSQNTNIRDQIRLLRSTPVDVLISTPGRLATILRTKNAGLDLSAVKSTVLDEVDFLLVDETFGPQLRTVGAAVAGSDASGEEGGRNENGQPQFAFVTATLPEDVLSSIRTEFPSITELRGPGLHRITPAVHQTLVDVSVPPESFKDARACFDIKLRELFKALRSRRTAKTLVFCNTVETCRNVENALKRKDKKSKINSVWAYHNALSAEVRLKNLHSFSHDTEDNNAGEGTERILVCTDQAARGIDFDASPVDHVILFDFPKDPAEYVRRVGRTARAGRDGASTVFAYGWQLPLARQIMHGSGKGKNKGGKLEKFTMMKSSDGWDEAEQEREREDEYYVKGGAMRRKEIAANGGEFKKGAGGGGGKGSRGNVFKKKK